jgi:N-dimethyltransferase
MTARKEEDPMEYGPEQAEIYDVVLRSRGKDFDGEAESVAALVRSRLPDSRSLLDIACGTGAHLACFQNLFGHVAGLEISPGMREIAAKRLPGVRINAGDMRDFDLDATFDAVVCLGNAIGCVADFDELTAAIRRMSAHLVPRGVMVVEPWFFPETFLDGHFGGHLTKDDGRVIARLTHSVRDGDATRHEVKFVVADSGGIREFSEVYRISLFTQEQYQAAFEHAGCAVELVPGFDVGGRPNSPGLFVGVRK